MKIAIIGAGIAGLTAGKELAEAGHEIVVFEKSRGFGGRLATRYAGDKHQLKFDHGVPYFEAHTADFQQFVVELMDKDIVRLWNGDFVIHDGEGFVPASLTAPRYVAGEGMNKIGQYLSRWVDVRTETRVGGITHVGGSGKKRNWMLNLQSSDTEGFDAIIIATPAKQAYAILNTTIDEISTLNIVKDVDEVSYLPTFSLLLQYTGGPDISWNAAELPDHPSIRWISNEVSKERGAHQKGTFVVHSSYDFAQAHINDDRDEIMHALLDDLGGLLGSWAGLPTMKNLHFWRYSKPENPIHQPFLEVRNQQSPVALIGAYMNGDTVESAFHSGKALARHWNTVFGK
ncbi:MAG: FAD-dependent oxidoreductase [Bacteroidota bacterium]